MRRKSLQHYIFAVSLWVKAIDGALEIIGGAILLAAHPAAINRLVVVLTQHELVEDPQDLAANTLRHAAAQLSAGARLFGSVYLIAHGLIKVGVVAGVLRGRRWAYPVAIGFLGLFIIYQIYRLSYSFSPGLLLLTLFDTLIVALVWREYRHASSSA